MFRLLILLGIISCQSIATSFHEPTLDELVLNSDVVLTAEIKSVDAIDFEGNISTSPDASMGLGSRYIIRLHAELITVLESKYEIPRILTIELAPSRILTLGTYRKYVLGQQYILFLKGSDFQKTTPVFFMQPIERKEKILRLIKCDT